MKRNYDPERAIFRVSRDKDESETTVSKEADFEIRKKNSLVYLLIGVIAGGIAIVSLFIYNGLDDPFSYTITSGQSFWSTTAGIAGVIAGLSIFGAIVSRITAEIKR